ncbi:energy transducer TonB [Dankookia sp. GCM10030260]|uniref:energy transducer TonB n=1 Tax=Dankookia sp. GCM10030260 TaxID=3273390 RepID=UPI0036D3D971
MPPVPGERAAVLRPPRPLPSWAPLLSLLLHAAALGAVLVLLERGQAPETPPERGVEVVWDASQEAELVTGAPSPAQPPSVAAPPEPEAPRDPPPPPSPATPPPAPPPPPQAVQAPPGIAPPQPAPPAEPAPVLAMQLPPPPPAAVNPVTLPPPPPAAVDPVTLPPPPADEPEPEAAAEVPLPPPMPPPAPRPEPARQVPARQQAAPPPAAAAAQPGPAAAPQAPVPPGGSQATGRVTPPGLLSGVRNAEPEYPFASRQRGEQGVVGVVIRVAEDGSVLAVEVAQSSGHPALDDSARRAVLRWKLKPATRDGVPIPGSIRTAIHFSLR